MILAMLKPILVSLSLCALPVLAGAESLPPSIRACAAETDSLRRLVCYDREVARFPDTKPMDNKPAAKHESAPAAPTGNATAANITPPASPASSPAPTTQPPVPPPARASQDSGKKDAAHFSAQVVSIDRAPNEMVLHLDNGQAWQQLQQVPGDLTLQVGDTVKIDKRLGSWWLTGPHVSGMKVRQKS
jgi:hypothetical protein